LSHISRWINDIAHRVVSSASGVGDPVEVSFAFVQISAEMTDAP